MDLWSLLQPSAAPQPSLCRTGSGCDECTGPGAGLGLAGGHPACRELLRAAFEL